MSSKNSLLQAAPLAADVPRVSVIIPTYNNARFLPASLQSVFSQNYADYEVIVVDDGSTDETTAVLEPFAGRLRYRWQPNAGSAVARNTALDMARGEYVVFLDADDLLLPGKLREQAAFLEVRPSIGAVHSGWIIINGAGEQLRCIEPWQWAPTLNLETWLRYKPVRMGSMMFRRLWLESIGRFDPEFRQAQDFDMLLRLMLQGCKMEWMYRPTLSYRVYPESTIRKDALKQYHFAMGVLDKFYASPHLPPKFRDQEHEIRYHSLVWLGWHLYSCGNGRDMIVPLREALALSPWPRAQTVFEILKVYLHWFRGEGFEIGQLEEIWPWLGEASGMPEQEWQVVNRLFHWWVLQNPALEQWRFNDLMLLWPYWQMANRQSLPAPIYPEQLMDWWVYVWWCAMQGDVKKVRLELPARFAAASPETLVQLAQLALAMDCARAEPERLTQFWQELMQLKLVPPEQATAVTGLYLTFFGQSALGRQWPRARQGFGLALGQGVSGPAIRAWVDFFRNSWRYFVNG